MSKRIKRPEGERLPSAFWIFKNSLSHIRLHWRLFGGIALVYLLVTVIFVRGLGSFNNLQEVKNSLQELAGGQSAGLITGLTLFGLLLGSNSATTEVGSMYQSAILVIVVLAVIWALRQTHADKQVAVRDAFYKGIYPLIPFVLVLVVVSLQLLPLGIGNFLYGTVFGEGLAITSIERFAWGVLILLLGLLSFYMIASSLFALFIVTLPDVRPLQALRSARQLVMHRRWEVLRKVIFLPFIMLILAAVIFLPLLFLVPVLAEALFLVLLSVSVIVFVAYMYGLYRAML